MGYPNFFRYLALFGVAATLFQGVGCSLLATRPTQELSDTAAALRAAKEVQADILSPDLYRQASETFQKARRAYRLKEFAPAEDLLKTARLLAERAEYESVISGATRSESSPDDPYQEMPEQKLNMPQTPRAKPAQAHSPTKQNTLPEPIPVESYDQRMAEQKAEQAKQDQANKDFQSQSKQFKAYPDPPQVLVPNYGAPATGTSTSTTTSTQ